MVGVVNLNRPPGPPILGGTESEGFNRCFWEAIGLFQRLTEEVASESPPKLGDLGGAKDANAVKLD